MRAARRNGIAKAFVCSASCRYRRGIMIHVRLDTGQRRHNRFSYRWYMPAA